ncbi:MAG: diguanylate cyclase [Desulfobacteraceae bacterium]|nr:MAG: diguanylate cyclase [Desulfobacteraceae bacterium]
MINFPILVVDDNPIIKKMMNISLTKAGYEVSSAENGRDALRKFDKKFYPIVITDWMMPEMDGLELCRAIRNLSLDSYVFIILLTAKDAKDDIIKGLEAGADDYLTKPVNHPELMARLNTGIRILELERSLKKANNEIMILSITDYLTGCYNRGYIGENLSKEIRRAERYKHPLSLVICDIDHFKNVNDTCGHLAGDHVLYRFAGLINKSIRIHVDWLARYGGEEFMIVLPETDMKGAITLCEKLRSIIENSVFTYNETNIKITSSFGFTSFDLVESCNDKIVDEIINRADTYLYQAKQEGRNCVRGGPF